MSPIYGKSPVMLDLFCGAGGCSAGYMMAGFYTIGIDHEAQQNYPYEFIKMDALLALRRLDLRNIDAIHASPPCQTHSTLRYMREDRRGDPELIDKTREALEATGKPYIIENVVGAPLLRPTILCGSMFRLGVRRHRLFETNFPVPQPECRHDLQTPKYKNPDKRGPALSGTLNVYGKCSYPGERELREEAMEINWMTNYELTQAVPPSYAKYIGDALMSRPIMQRFMYRTQKPPVVPFPKPEVDLYHPERKPGHAVFEWN